MPRTSSCLCLEGPEGQPRPWVKPTLSRAQSLQASGRGMDLLLKYELSGGAPSPASDPGHPSSHGLCCWPRGLGLVLALLPSAGIKPRQVSLLAAALGVGQRWRASPVSHPHVGVGWGPGYRQTC